MVKKKSAMVKRKRTNKSTTDKSTDAKPKRTKAKKTQSRSASKKTKAAASASKTKKKTPKKAKPEIVTQRDSIPRAADVDKTDFKVNYTQSCAISLELFHLRF